MEPVHVTLSSSLIRPLSSPARDTMTLNVDPGGYTLWIARLYKGCEGSLESRTQSLGAMPRGKRLGS